MSTCDRYIRDSMKMTRVRVEGFTISLDGYGAGPNQDISNPPRSGYGSYARGQGYYDNQENSGRPYNYRAGQSLPYSDRPYGDPDVD